MKEPSEEIRKQMHELRNLIGHLQLAMTDLREQISEIRISVDEKIERMESRLLASSFQIGEQQREIAKCLGKHKISEPKSGE